VACVDYSGDKVKVYGLIAVREENLKALERFLPMSPHFSEIKVKFAKMKILKSFPRRYERVRNYVEKLVVSSDLQDIVKELERLRSEIKRVYVDAHVYRRIKSS